MHRRMKEYKEREIGKYWDKAAKLESWECLRMEKYKRLSGMKEEHMEDKEG